MAQHMIVLSAPYVLFVLFWCTCAHLENSCSVLNLVPQPYHYSVSNIPDRSRNFSEHSFLLWFPKEVCSAHLFSKMLVGYISWSISSSTSRNFWWCHMHNFLNLNIQIYSFLLVSHCPHFFSCKWLSVYSNRWQLSCKVNTWQSFNSGIHLESTAVMILYFFHWCKIERMFNGLLFYIFSTGDLILLLFVSI